LALIKDYQQAAAGPAGVPSDQLGLVVDSLKETLDELLFVSAAFFVGLLKDLTMNYGRRRITLGIDVRQC